MSFSAVSGWIDFIRRVVFFNSCHVSLGRSSVFSSLQNVWNNKTAELPLILLSRFSLIISETDVKLYWYTSTVTGYEELAVSFGSSLSSTPQNSSERHEVWILFTSMILTENRKCGCPSINGHKNCVKSTGASSRTFLVQLRPSYFQPPYALRQAPPFFFLKKILLAGKITVYKGRNITSVMSRKLRKRDKKKWLPYTLGLFRTCLNTLAS